MKYIASEKFILKEVAGEKVLMARGTEAIDFSAVVVFNEVGLLLFDELKTAKSTDELALFIKNKYDISVEQATNDVDAFIKKMLDEGIVLTVEE